MRDLPAGVYRHYKGPLYLVLGYAHDANADVLGLATTPGSSYFTPFGGERTVVVYVGLELDGAHRGARLAVRTVDDFFAVVCAGDSTCLNYGREVSFRADSCVHCGTPTRQRFAYVGPTWEGP